MGFEAKPLKKAFPLTPRIMGELVGFLQEFPVQVKHGAEGSVYVVSLESKEVRLGGYVENWEIIYSRDSQGRARIVLDNERKLHDPQLRNAIEEAKDWILAYGFHETEPEIFILDRSREPHIESLGYDGVDFSTRQEPDSIIRGAYRDEQLSDVRRTPEEVLFQSNHQAEPSKLETMRRPTVEMRDPSSLDYTEEVQNRLDEVREYFPGDEYNPVVYVEDVGIIDGHNRTTVARERGHKIPVVEVPNTVYEHLKGLGYDNMEISFAALDLAAERDAANALVSQFPGSSIERRGNEASWEWREFTKTKHKASMEKSADYEMAWFRSFMTMIKDSIQEAHPELDLDESSFWQNTYSVMAKGTQNDKPYARKLIEFDLQSDAETILATILTWYQKDLQEDLEDILMTHGFNTEHDSPSGNPEHIHMRGVFPEDLGPYEI
jgi:hypothetical protein